MTAQTLIHRMVAHHLWANREYLAALSKLKNPPDFAVSLMAHVIASDSLWFARIRGESTVGQNFWPKWTVKTMAKEFDSVMDLWAEANLWKENRLTEPVTYVNSRGEQYTSEVADILTHVLMHAHYHRAQIARTLRLTDVTPPATDYIEYRRSVAED